MRRGRGPCLSELIYVRLLDRSELHLWPVQAELEHGTCYRVLDDSEDPEHFIHEFQADEVVLCERRVFAPGETGLVAVAPCRCSDISPGK